MRRSSTQILLLCSQLWSYTSAVLHESEGQQPLVNPISAPVSSAPPHDASEAPPYREQLLSLHKDLVDISSISRSEGDISIYLERFLKDHGYSVELQCLPREESDHETRAPPRCNVLAWPGANSSRTFDGRLLVTSHIDVVPPFIPYHINASDPASITPDTLVSGRGSVDAKASVAAQIVAVNSLLFPSAQPSTPAIDPDSLALLFVVGEEISGDGMKFFSSSLSSSSSSSSSSRAHLKAAIFGEPTENRLACGHKGILTGTISARGRAGHSGYPWLGRSATALLVRALDALLERAADLGRSERYGNTTVNVGVLRGGVAANVIAAEASARVAMRIAVGEEGTGAQIVEERVRRVLREVGGEEGGLEFEVAGGYGPVECDCDVDGFETMVANYGTDVPNLKGDHVNYLYGPGSILVAHGENEGLRVGDLETAVEGYKKLIKHVLKA